VKETYNKKTRTLGSFEVNIVSPKLSYTEYELLKGERLYTDYWVQFPKADTLYYINIENYDDIVENNTLIIDQDEYGTFVYANKAGTAKLTVREGSKDGKSIGTITFVVSEAPCEEIIPDLYEYTTYEGDLNFNIYFDLEPWNTTDTVIVTSDNTDVLSVSYNEDYRCFDYKVGKAGKANVTIKCGDKSAVVVVTVVEEEE
jgi:hypothetical protein